MHTTERIQHIWTLDKRGQHIKYISVGTIYEGKDYAYNVTLMQPRGALHDLMSFPEIKELRHKQNFVRKTHLVGLGEANGLLYELYLRYDGTYKLYIYDVIKYKCDSASAVHLPTTIDFIID